MSEFITEIPNLGSSDDAPKNYHSFDSSDKEVGDETTTMEQSQKKQSYRNVMFAFILFAGSALALQNGMASKGMSSVELSKASSMSSLKACPATPESDPNALAGGRLMLPNQVGKSFKSQYTRSDLMRGFKINEVAGNPLKGPVFFLNDNKEALVLEKTAQQHNLVRVIQTIQDMNDVLGVEGELSVSYGPATGKGSGSYLSKEITTKKRVLITYVDRMSYYQIKFVNNGALNATRDVQALITADNMNEIYNKYGTYIASAVQYGCSIYAKYEITSETDMESTAIEAQIKGKIGVGALKGEIAAGLTVQKGKSKAKFELKIEGSVSGMSIDFPILENLKGFLEANNIIKQYNTEKKKLQKAVENVTDVDLLNGIGLGKRFTAVAVELDRIDNYIIIPNMDPNAANFINDETKKAGKVIQESNLLRGRLEAEKDALEKDHGSGEDRQYIFYPYRDATNLLFVSIDKKVDDCFKYLQTPVGEIICGILRAPPGLDDQDIDDGAYMLGEGFVKNPWNSESMSFEGYTLPPPKGKDKKPFYKGSLKCNENKYTVLEDKPIDFLEKFVNKNMNFDERKNCIEGVWGECTSGIVKGLLKGGVVTSGGYGRSEGGAYRIGADKINIFLRWTVPEPLKGDFQVRSEVLFEKIQSTATGFVLFSKDGPKTVLDLVGFDGNSKRMFYEGPHWGVATMGGPSPSPNVWHEVLFTRIDGQLTVSVDGAALLTDLPCDWTVIGVGWRPSRNTIQLRSLEVCNDKPLQLPQMCRCFE